MKVQRVDHVGINVDDLPAAKTFFVDLGLEAQGETELEGEWLDQVVGLKGVKSTVVFLAAPDGQAGLELIKYHTPSDEQGIQRPLANTLGIRHIAIAVEDIDAIVAKLKKRGTEFISEVQTYEDSYKLCHLRGPENIILELAESLK